MPNPSDKKICIVVPVFNEERNVSDFYATVKPVLASLPVDFELLFVDDGSVDSTVKEVRRLMSSDTRVKLIELSRNFGKEIALSAGVNHAQGDACILMDADLQHPVEIIPEFVAKWRAGAEVVIGVRRNMAARGWLRRLGTASYYFIMSSMSDTPFVPGATDYRLLDRCVMEEFNRFTERGRLTRALIDWLGFRRDFVVFTAGPRRFGGSRFGMFQLTKLALSNMVSHSLLPLKLAGYLGIAITVFSGLLGLFILIEKYLLDDPWSLHFSGPATLAVITLFLVGIVLCCLGLIALYIANIHGEVANRPLYVIRHRSAPDSRPQ